MSYADGDVQWMRAGRGVIHEEMWDLSESEWSHKRIEIFQLWVNLPAKSKSNPPAVHLLKNTDIPNVDCGDGASIKVICGSILNSPLGADNNDIERDILVQQQDIPVEAKMNKKNSVNREVSGPGSIVAESPVNILHLSMIPGSFPLNLSADKDCTVTVYVRRGSLIMENGNKTEIRAGDLVIFRPPSLQTIAISQLDNRNIDNTDQAVAILTPGLAGLDALVLTGKPLNERVIFQGPLVLADEESFRKSAQTFNRYVSLV